MMQSDLPGRATAGALAAALVAGGLAAAPAPAAAQSDLTLPDLVERVSPSVVTVMTVNEQEGGNRQIPAPFREFFRRFGPEGMPGMPDGGDGGDRVRRGLGSGFVYDADGLIVTNHHVVDGAETVRVRFQDGDAMTAEVIGSDEETDIALLRVEADGLAAVPLGDSDAVRVGETVAAVGNPFGLSTTVTKGIISADGRSMPGSSYVDFFQTDAAINRGNSGGPLFNMAGEVIGVNTAIFSPSGGNVGIGFAVTSNIVEDVVADLREDGRVERGWLGVSIQAVTPEIAEAVGLDTPRGALVAGLVEGSPSSGALQPGDVILSFAGEDVAQSRELPFLVGRTSPGEEVSVKVLRDGETRTVGVTLGSLGDYKEARADTSGQARDEEAAETAALGARIAPLTPRVRARLDIAEDVSGVVVADVDPSGRAAQAGLRPGDVIEEVGGEAITSPEDLAERIEAIERDSALFVVNRGGNRIFVGVRLAA